jgi:hypothetical protein
VPRHDIELEMAEAQVARENREPVREEKIRDRQFGPKAQLPPVQIPCAAPQFASVGSQDVQTAALYAVLFFMQYAPVRPESVTPIELTSWVHVKPSGHVQ